LETTGPLAKITFEQAVKFVTGIIHRFGVPDFIITDNGTRFTENRFLELCDEYHVRVDWLSWLTPAQTGRLNEPTE
jgi:hypothetical protein